MTAKASTLFSTTCGIGMMINMLQTLGIIGGMTVDWPVSFHLHYAKAILFFCAVLLPLQSFFPDSSLVLDVAQVTLGNILGVLQIFAFDIDGLGFACISESNAVIRYVTTVPQSICLVTLHFFLGLNILGCVFSKRYDLIFIFVYPKKYKSTVYYMYMCFFNVCIHTSTSYTCIGPWRPKNHVVCCDVWQKESCPRWFSSPVALYGSALVASSLDWRPTGAGIGWNSTAPWVSSCHLAFCRNGSVPKQIVLVLCIFSQEMHCSFVGTFNCLVCCFAKRWRTEWTPPL